MTASGNFTPAQLRRVAPAVRRLEEIEQLQRALDAERVTLLADAHEAVLGGATNAERELAHRSLRLELATALSRSEPSVERLIDLAGSLTTHYGDTLVQLRDGHIQLEHARIISDAGTVFQSGDPEADAARRGAYETEVLDHARCETPPRLRPIAQAIAARYSEQAIEDRHREAAQRRCVRLRDLDAGMAEIVAFLPAVEAHAVFDRLTRIARATAEEEAAARRADPDAAAPPGAQLPSGAAPGSESGSEVGGTPDANDAELRNRDAVRADVFRDLLLAGTTDKVSPTAPDIHAKVQVVVPIGLLLPRDNSVPRRPGSDSSAPTHRGTRSRVPDDHSTPEHSTVVPGSRAPELFAALGRRASTGGPGVVAELIGHGPIPATQAARLAQGSRVWEGVFTTPNGDVLAVDRYTPTPEMHRRIRARDLHCRAPGCRAPAHRCDVDHTIAASEGGATSTSNLALLCRAHHTLKHHSDWQLTQLPGGVLRWTSPTGRISIDRPPSRVRFQSATAPGSTPAAGSTTPTATGSTTPPATEAGTEAATPAATAADPAAAADPDRAHPF